MSLRISQKDLLAGGIYALLAVFCILFAKEVGSVAYVWLPNPFAFAWLLRHPRASWFGSLLMLYAGNVLANLLTGAEAGFSLLLSLCNLLAYGAGAYLALRLPGKWQAELTLRRVLILMLFYGLLISPVSGVMAALLIQHLYAMDFLTTLSNWWLGDVVGLLFLFVPAYCVVPQTLRSLLSWRRFPTLVLLTLAGTASSLLILHYVPFPYVYVVVPFGLIALQFGLLMTVVVTPLSIALASTILWLKPELLPIWLRMATAEEVLTATAMCVLLPSLIGLSTRLSRRQQAEVEELKDRLEMAGESIGLGVWDWNVPTGALHWDARMYRLYDITPEQGSNTYDMWRSRVHPDDVNMAEHMLSNAVAGKGEYRTEFRVLHRDGSLRWIMAAAVVVRDHAGNALRVVGMNWDSSERKLSELRLRDAQARLEAVINAAEDFAIITTDEQGIIQLFSRGAQRMLGYSAAEMEHKQSPYVLHDVDEITQRGQELSKEYGRYIRGFEIFVCKAKTGLSEKRQWTYISRNGRRIPVRLTVSAIYDSNGQVNGYLGVAQDISDELESRNALQQALNKINEQADIAQQAKEQFETLFTMAPEALLVVDKLGYIQQANVRAHELFKYPHNALPGVMVDSLLPDNLRAMHRLHRETYNQNPVPRLMGPGMSFSGKQRDGGIVALDINLAPIMVQGERHIIVTLHDVTAQHRAQQLMHEAAQKAEAMSRAKSEFVASMSHEIRTPMNAVLASSQLLQNTPLNNEQSRYVHTIHSAGNALLGILNDILDFSKIEAGQFSLQIGELNISRLCETLANIMSTNAAQKKIELVIGVDVDVPAVLCGDALRLQQVLINLLGNAIKFTEKGEVQLHISRVPQPGDMSRLRFSVKDTGIGISAEQQEKLFVAFSQVDSSHTRKYGGTGLGLTISQRLVNMMGGQIRVQSAAGQGSEFLFEINLPVIQAQAPVVHAKISRQFIVLDKNAHSRKFISQYINAFGYECQTFQDIEELNVLSPQEHCFILEWDASGPLEKFIRSLEVGTPVFMLLRADQQADLLHIQRLDIAGVINKPVLSSALYNAIMSVFAPQQICAQSNKLELDGALQGCRILLVEDNVLNQMVATEILETMGAVVEVAQNGAECLTMLRNPDKVFDVVLMDVQMPIMDGFEATRQIRHKLRLDIPVLAMTAGVMDSERQECIEAGMDDFIAKPIDIPQMLRVIQANIFKA